MPRVAFDHVLSLFPLLDPSVLRDVWVQCDHEEGQTIQMITSIFPDGVPPEEPPVPRNVVSPMSRPPQAAAPARSSAPVTTEILSSLPTQPGIALAPPGLPRPHVSVCFDQSHCQGVGLPVALLVLGALLRYQVCPHVW